MHREYAENELAMKRNDPILNDLPEELYTIDTHEKVPDNCKHPLSTFQSAQNKKQTNTRGLAKFLKLKFGAKVLLKVSLDIQDRLINGQT